MRSRLFDPSVPPGACRRNNFVDLSRLLRELALIDTRKDVILRIAAVLRDC